MEWESLKKKRKLIYSNALLLLICLDTQLQFLLYDGNGENITKSTALAEKQLCLSLCIFFFVYSFVPVCCNVIQIVFYFQNGWEAAAAVHNIINIKLTITLASIYSCLWYFVRFFFILFFVTPHNRASLFFLMWFFQTERNKNVYCSLKSLTGIDIFIAFFDYMGVCFFCCGFYIFFFRFTQCTLLNSIDFVIFV